MRIQKIVKRTRLEAAGLAAAVAPRVQKVVTRTRLEAAGVAAAVAPRVQKVVTRRRLEATGVVAACAVLVGLSAPTATAMSTTGPLSAGPIITHGGGASAADAGASGQSAGIVDAAAGAVAQAVAPAPEAPSEQSLHPVGVTANQQQFTPSVEQVRNAKAIVEAGKAMNLAPRAWTIAVATSLQESNLRNLGDLGASNDHDSLGLFQQRPSSGWGTPSQVQDPSYAATAFYRALVQVPGWDSLPLTVAAQRVQVSAYPDHYAKHEVEAGDIIESLYGQGPYAEVANHL